MNRFTTSVVATAAVIAFSVPGLAQIGGNPGSSPRGLPSGDLMRGSLNQEQFNKLQDYADQARRLTKEDKKRGKTLADVLAEDKVAAIAAVKAAPLACDVTAAMQVAEGPGTVDGKTVNTKTYEASCGNGMGYFLVVQDAGKPYGFSCFAADATRTADVAAGRTPGAVCQLPQNADLKAVGTQVLAMAGTTCVVRDFKWVGQNAANHTEFDEFACEGGQGYMVISGLPGVDIAVHVETCNASAARGLPCKLSDNGVLPVTLKTLRDEIAKRNIVCDAGDGTTRVVGREEKAKRYVVEFQCTERPAGLVAFIPLQGSTAPFEALDCATAKKRGVVCTMAKPHS